MSRSEPLSRLPLVKWCVHLTWPPWAICNAAFNHKIWNAAHQGDFWCHLLEKSTCGRDRRQTDNEKATPNTCVFLEISNGEPIKNGRSSDLIKSRNQDRAHFRAAMSKHGSKESVAENTGASIDSPLSPNFNMGVGGLLTKPESYPNSDLLILSYFLPSYLSRWNNEKLNLLLSSQQVYIRSYVPTH